MLKSIVAATVIGGWLNSNFWGSELRETLRGSLSKFAGYKHVQRSMFAGV